MNFGPDGDLYVVGVFEATTRSTASGPRTRRSSPCRSRPRARLPLTVNYATADGTAVAGSDYTATSGTLTFAPGVTSETIRVPILDDTVYEPNETFTVNLSNPVGATITDGQGVATIQDNDSTTTTFTKTVNLSIPDKGTRTSVLNVAAAGTILDLNVKLNISHTNDADLDVFLIAPDGTRVELTTDNGGSGDNYTNTVLDDDVTALVTAGSAPFTGTYKPEGNLTGLEGKNLAGNWTLEVTDDTNSKTGTLLNWSIIVNYAPTAQPAAVVGDGAIAGPVLTVDHAAPILAAAQARWKALGVNTEALRAIRVQVADLPGGPLATMFGSTLTLDDQEQPTITDSLTPAGPRSLRSRFTSSRRHSLRR